MIFQLKILHNYNYGEIVIVSVELLGWPVIFRVKSKTTGVTTRCRYAVVHPL